MTCPSRRPSASTRGRSAGSEHANSRPSSSARGSMDSTMACTWSCIRTGASSTARPDLAGDADEDGELPAQPVREQHRQQRAKYRGHHAADKQAAVYAFQEGLYFEAAGAARQRRVDVQRAHPSVVAHQGDRPAPVTALLLVRELTGRVGHHFAGLVRQDQSFAGEGSYALDSVADAAP